MALAPATRKAPPRRGCRAGDVTQQVPTPSPVLRESWEREACGMRRFRGPRDPGGQWSHCSLISCLGFPSLPCPTWEETPIAEPCASWGLGTRGRRLPPTPPPPPAGPAAVTGPPHLWPVTTGTVGGLGLGQSVLLVLLVREAGAVGRHGGTCREDRGEAGEPGPLLSGTAGPSQVPAWSFGLLASVSSSVKRDAGTDLVGPFHPGPPIACPHPAAGVIPHQPGRGSHNTHWTPLWARGPPRHAVGERLLSRLVLQSLTVRTRGQDRPNRGARKSSPNTASTVKVFKEPSSPAQREWTQHLWKPSDSKEKESWLSG